MRRAAISIFTADGKRVVFAGSSDCPGNSSAATEARATRQSLQIFIRLTGRFA
jgi:hypothetical protein